MCTNVGVSKIFFFQSQCPIRVKSCNMKITDEIVNFCHDLKNQEVHVHVSTKEHSDSFRASSCPCRKKISFNFAK